MPELALPSPSRPCPPGRSVVPALLLLLFPFVFPGVVIFAHDGLIGADRPEFHLPHQRFIHEHLRRGVIPFWNPYQYGGFPEFGNPEMAPMYPFHFPVLMLLGPVWMLQIKYLVHIGLAGAGLFLFLRSLAVAPWLAFLGGLTLEASGFTITKIALPNVGDSAAWAGLMLFLSLRFARRPDLARGLALALAGGCMLLLFFPQITVTLILLMAFAGAARFVKCRARAGQPRFGPAWWIDRAVLPALEMTVIVTLLRYPPNAVAFPQEGWRCAFDGLGWEGGAALACVPVAWGLWLIARRLHARVDWAGLSRWAIRFGLVWVLAAGLAAPQLAVTGALVSRSNQAALRFEENDFFTGAQAYGCVQEFFLKSALGLPKESVNNMAIGPMIYLLATAGVAAGFHRRRRAFLLIALGAALAGAYYFAAPGVFDVARRLPFFSKFAGLSRYLAFLNLFLIVLAILSAHLWLRLTPRRWRTFGRWLVAGGLIANLGVLARHQVLYWEHVTAKTPPPSVAAARRLVEGRIGPGERLAADSRGRDDFVSILMFPFESRVEGIAGYGPLRPLSYDLFMRAHNRSVGVDRDDYRAGTFEPVPTPWTRALRARLFLFPPDRGPEVKTASSVGTPDATSEGLAFLGEAGGWRLFEDPKALPAAWPEANLDRKPPAPEIPPGWSAERTSDGPHRATYKVENPGRETWLVTPTARYAGWEAWVDGKRAETALAYGFLQAVRVPRGESAVRLEYRPPEFAFGWVCFLWAVWGWIALVLSLEKGARTAHSRPRKRFWILAVAGIAPALAVGVRALTTVPDSLWARCAELCLIALLAVLAGGILRHRPGEASSVCAANASRAAALKTSVR